MNIGNVNIKSTEFQAMENHFLIKPQELEFDVKSDSGIVVEIKRSSLERPCCGTVIAAGKNELGITEGDFVIYPSTDGLDIKMLDGTFVILYTKSITGKKKNV